MKEKVKRHGCSWPMHPYQIISYIVFLFKVSTYYSITIRAFAHQEALQYVLSCFYSILLIILACITFLATIADPTDPTVYEERNKKNLE